MLGSRSPTRADSRDSPSPTTRPLPSKVPSTRAPPRAILSTGTRALEATPPGAGRGQQTRAPVRRTPLQAGPPVARPGLRAPPRVTLHHVFAIPFAVDEHPTGLGCGGQEKREIPIWVASHF